MRPENKFFKTLFVSASLLAATSGLNKAMAQVGMYSEGKHHSVYLSVGFNMAKYSPSTINIKQSSAAGNSSYTLDNVSADNENASGGFSNNIRLGYFFNGNQTWALELAYDPISYHIEDGQSVNLKGTMENVPIDTNFAFSKANGYAYYLNGSNLLAVNIVRRFQLYNNKMNTLRIDALAKVGAGPVMPHVLNTLRGKTAEYPSFQLGGWNAGVEGAVRVTIFRYVFVDIAPKYSYASYTDIGVYNGTARQNLKTFQMIFSLGLTFPTTKHNPLFIKNHKEVRALTIKPIYPGEDGEGGGGAN